MKFLLILVIVTLVVAGIAWWYYGYQLYNKPMEDIHLGIIW